MDNKINIALVDDHKILLDGIESLLQIQQNLNIIIKEESGEALLNRSDVANIDLLISDINMKGKDGISVLKELPDRGFRGKCIFLSSYDDLKLVNEAVQYGAQGYVTKSSATEHLEEAIESVMKGELYYSPDIRGRILRAFTKSNNSQASGTQEKSFLRQLTERELEVLKLIGMQHTSEEIAQKLHIAKSTVDTHRKNLIYKLKVKNAVGLGLFAERNGLL